ncbi:hypothetical protein AAU60_15435 [Acinetobacter johnsonii]|nr:hypothetical protein AAU60_15435 [Acinetobacter johnsonii]
MSSITIINNYFLQKLIFVLNDIIFISGAKNLLNALLIFFAASCILAYNGFVAQRFEMQSAPN